MKDEFTGRTGLFVLPALFTTRNQPLPHLYCTDLANVLTPEIHAATVLHILYFSNKKFTADIKSNNIFSINLHFSFG